MSDLVKVLRAQERLQHQPNGEESGMSILLKNAADEIERLRADIDFLNTHNEEAAREWLAEEKEKWKSSVKGESK